MLLNKPIGYVSGQAEDGYRPAAALVTAATRWAEDKRPFDPGHPRDLAPAGRLDIDSTGLLVLTQDGRVAKLLIGDDSRVEKEYLVRVAQVRSPACPSAVAAAAPRPGARRRAAEAGPGELVQRGPVAHRAAQGKKRQIRRMCELVGLKVTGLKRVRIGSVVLGALPVGQWRYLGDDERF